MPLSYAQYAGNGSTTTFSVPFPYILKAHVKVYLGFNILNGTYTSELVDGTGFTWTSGTQIQCTTAPAVGQTLTVIRQTPSSSRLVDWNDGSNLIAADMDTADLQNLYVVQEQQDRNDSGITQSTSAINTATSAAATATAAAAQVATAYLRDGSVAMTGNIAAGGFRLTNAGTPVSATDGATKGYVDGFVSQTANIANSAVTTAKLADSSVTSAKIADGTIAAADLAADSVTTAKILDANITTAKIADQNVTTAKVADLAIATGKLADSAVTTAKIADSNVTTAKIADANVTTTKIADQNVTTGKVADLGITTGKLADGAVTTAKVADGAITNAKLADADLQALAGAQAGAAAAFATLAAGEVSKLSGLTATTAELNKLNGVTANTSEINRLTGLTSSTSELNQLTGKTISGTLTPGNANDIPTSTAVNSWVSNLINALGGFVAIANRNSFPTENPDPSDNAGTVVSIADAGGLVVNASGVATNAQTTGSAAVTISGFPAAYQGKTLNAGLGIQVQTTTTLNTYTFHKSIPTDADIAQLSDDVNDFFARYRIGATNPTTNNDAGDLFFNTTVGKMLVYNGLTSAWEEVQSIGNFTINTLSSSAATGGGSATFDGTAYRFALSNAPLFAQQLLVSVNGVIQRPNSGTTQPAEGYAIDGNDIIFSQAPAASSPFFIVTMGSTVNIGTPSDGTVSTVKLVDGSVTTGKVASGAITSAKLGADLTVDLASGSAAAPSLTFDANTGIYSPGEDQVAISTGGSGRLFVDSSGNVGIGTASPVTQFHIQKATGGLAGVQISTSTHGSTLTDGLFVGIDNSLGYLYQYENLPLVFGTNATERLRITSDGKVGIGTTTPATDFVVFKSGVGLELDTSGGFAGAANTGTLRAFDRPTLTYRTLGLTGSNVILGVNDQEAARIDSSKRLLVGTSSHSASTRAVFVGHSSSSTAEGIVFLQRGSAASNGNRLGDIRFTDNSDNSFAGIAGEADGTVTGGSKPGRLVFSTTADGASSPTERMRITSLGRFLVGTQSLLNNSYLAHFSSTVGGCVWAEATGGGDAAYVSRSPANVLGMHFAGLNDAQTIVYRVNQNGNVQNTNNSYGPIASDKRLKQDIVDANSQWDDIKNIRITNFHYKNDLEGPLHLGPIAQELEQVSPGLITRRPASEDEIADPSNGLVDGDEVLSFKASILYMKAVKALQEAMERIEQLEAEMAEVKAQLS